MKLPALCLTECPAASGISAEGPDHQGCHRPLRQRAPALLPGETSAGAQGQGGLRALHRGKERYCPCLCCTGCCSAGCRCALCLAAGWECWCLSLLWSPRGSSMVCQRYRDRGAPAQHCSLFAQAQRCPHQPLLKTVPC